MLILKESHDMNYIWLSIGRGNTCKNKNPIIEVHSISNSIISLNTSTFNHSVVAKDITELLPF